MRFFVKCHYTRAYVPPRMSERGASRVASVTARDG